MKLDTRDLRRFAADDPLRVPYARPPGPVTGTTMERYVNPQPSWLGKIFGRPL